MSSVPTDAPAELFDGRLVQRAEEALRTLPATEETRAYLEKHISRLAKTIALAPAAGNTGRALELGCYMQITPFLAKLRGYREVRGAYYGPLGRIDRKTVQLPDGEFTCYVDLFDAERDRFPYPDGHFDLVVAGEIIEHMAYDPMWLLVESRRVLAEGGRLLISTPNAASLANIAKALDGRDNPQIFPHYKHPDPRVPEIGHVHEYTAHELRRTVECAGFETERLFTTYLDEYQGHRHLLRLLEQNGYSLRDRGEQTWCVAVKRSSLPVDRYPAFLYSD
jgi:SAM-dependent methyltransferase